MKNIKTLDTVVTEINNFIEKTIEREPDFLSGYRESDSINDAVEEIGIGFTSKQNAVLVYCEGTSLISPYILNDIFVTNKNDTTDDFKKEVVKAILENTTNEDIEFEKPDEVTFNEQVLATRANYTKNGGSFSKDFFKNIDKYIEENPVRYFQDDEKAIKDMYKDGFFASNEEQTDFDYYDYDSFE